MILWLKDFSHLERPQRAFPSKYIRLDKFFNDTATCILDTLNQLALNGCTPSPSFDFRHNLELKGLDDIETITSLEKIYSTIFKKLLKAIAKGLGVNVEFGLCLKVSSEDRERLAEIIKLK